MSFTSFSHVNQHFYRAGLSRETTLHPAVSRVQMELDAKESAMKAFMDIEGAYNQTSWGIIVRALNRHSILLYNSVC